MSAPIGPFSSQGTAAAAFTRPAAPGRMPAGAGPGRAGAADSVELAFPSEPPPEVLEEMAAAADLAAELAAANRELHFQRDEASGRIVVQVRDLVGRVVRTIPPSGALELMAGERSWALVEHG